MRDPALVPGTIAQTLGAKVGLAEHIGERELLLVLDNLEQAIEAAPELATLVEQCSNLKLLVTSRELLQVRGEVEYAVPPLAEGDAVELFCSRAQLDPEPPIAELCRRLDNLPLAVELAAARARVLSPAQILERLSDRLDLLKGGRDAEARQQTLRATIEWSYELLQCDERRLFAKLGVFRGGCTLEAAQQVAEADLDSLQALVDKSLLRHSGERFWMLETIGEFARGRLSADGAEASLRQRYAEFFLEFSEEADRQALDGSIPYSNLLARVTREHDNLLAAMEWARDSSEDEVLLRLATALVDFWGFRGFAREAEAWATLALERGSSPPEVRTRLLQRAASAALVREKDVARAEHLIAQWRSEAGPTVDERELLRGMGISAIIAAEKGDLDGAREAWLEVRSMAGAAGDREREAAAALNLGVVAMNSGDFSSGFMYASEAADLFRDLGDESGVFTALVNGGWSALRDARVVIAADSFGKALVIARRMESVPFIADAATGLGATFVARHEEERGAELLGAATSFLEKLGIGLGDEDEEQGRERAIADAKQALGPDVFAAAWERGRAMTLEDLEIKSPPGQAAAKAAN